MIKIQEHKNKMLDIKKQISNSKGEKKKQLIKCLHRLQKELNKCYLYMK